MTDVDDAAAGAACDEVIAAEGISSRFGTTVALSDVTFAMRGSGILCILGPNGAGKTTLLDVLEGLSKPSAGSFRVFGRPPKPYPRRRVGVVMQNEARLERVTTREYAELFAAIYEIADGADRILDRSGLADRDTTPMIRLSGGEAARLFIATATVHAPDLLFLDEPTAHLDPASRLHVQDELRALARDHTVVMTTHDLAEADALADELLFLVDGTVRGSGGKAELVGSRTMEEAFFSYCAVHMDGHGQVADDKAAR